MDKVAEARKDITRCRKIDPTLAKVCFYCYIYLVFHSKVNQSVISLFVIVLLLSRQMLTCACMLFLKWYHLYVDNSFGLQSRLVKGLTLPEPLKIQGNFLDWLLSTGVNC